MNLPAGLSRRNLIGGASLASLAGSAARPSPSAGEPPASSSATLFNAARLPFSRYGSYWAISKLWWAFGASAQVPIEQWYIRILQDEATPNELFRIELLVGGTAAPFEGTLTPSSLVLSSGGQASVEFIIAADNLIRVRGHRCTLRLQAIGSAYSYAVRRSPAACELASVNIPRVQLSVQTGRLQLASHWVDELHKAACSAIAVEFQPGPAGSFEASLECYDAVPSAPARPSRSFDSARAAVRDQFAEWAGKLAKLQPPYEQARELAAWTLWSSAVAPRGLYQTPVVWCSKSWMNRIWSWDHCFVAVGLSPAHPELAWQQLMIFAAMQDPASGMLADSMNNIQRSWLCTKPPIHGWALRQLMRNGPVSRAQCEQVYEPLQRWTGFWTTHRNLDGDGLPCIINPAESFDNTTGNTLFAPVKPPEIAAYLALQMEVLADLATALGRAEEANEWHRRSKSLIETMLAVLWDGRARRFLARRIGDGKVAEGDSIFSYVPILLGHRLPRNVLDALTTAIGQPGRFLTPYGLTTEALTSPRFEPRSYVKGPVWAPPCTFIAEGLAAIGETALAAQIRRSFLRACLQSGMNEHFDAETGAGTGDPGYNWTAAMFLHFCREENLLA